MNETKRKTKKRKTNNRFLLILLLLNTQVFASVGINPFGVLWFQECFYLTLICYTIYYFKHLYSPKSISKNVDRFVLLCVVLSISYSAIASYIAFDQPLQYGFLEARKILSSLIYFPVVAAFRYKKIKLKYLIDCIIILAIICAVLTAIGSLYFYQPVSAANIEGLGGFNRLGVGQHSVLLGFVASLYLFKLTRQFKYVVAAILLIIVLGSIIQSKQLFVAAMLGGAVAYGLGIMVIIFTTAMIAALMGVQSDVFLDFLFRLSPRLSELFDGDYLADNARIRSIELIVSEISTYPGILGKGAVSAYWRGGFSAIYGKNFFLADVGIFGTLFRFGVFGLLLIFTYIIIQGGLILNARGSLYSRFCLSFWIILLVIWPTAAIIEYVGHLTGLCLALTVGAIVEHRMRLGVKDSSIGGSSRR